MKKNLSYFASLRVKQLQRKESKVDGWEKTFLDYGKTWTKTKGHGDVLVWAYKWTPWTV